MGGDPRVCAYARVLVEQCVGVQPGWQVILAAQPLARPLAAEVTREIGRRGAYALVRVRFDWLNGAWVKEAPMELLNELAAIERHAIEQADCFIAILAPENTRDGGDIPQERLAAVAEASRPAFEPFMADEKPWVGCQYPTNALAQDAGMALSEFEDFLYGAVLIDWEQLERKMRRIADGFDRAEEVRIVAPGTDLRLSLEGRQAKVSAAGSNMPSGEFFFGPVEDSAEGVIHFSEYPATYHGREIHGVRLRFESGRVVEASADSQQEFLLKTLDTDEGARRLGEFGVGCNPGIQRYMKNTLFDEKMEGTIHLALGNSYPATGGTNRSAIHWDLVKDLRAGGKIFLDGELAQESGRWVRMGEPMVFP